jgi:hypothetical protein
MDSCDDTPKGGLPHSDIHGSKPARGSPWLIAACHVLHRLLVPRHPPNALLILRSRGQSSAVPHPVSNLGPRGRRRETSLGRRPPRHADRLVSARIPRRTHLFGRRSGRDPSHTHTTSLNSRRPIMGGPSRRTAARPSRSDIDRSGGTEDVPGTPPSRASRDAPEPDSL